MIGEVPQDQPEQLAKGEDLLASLLLQCEQDIELNVEDAARRARISGYQRFMQDKDYADLKSTVSGADAAIIDVLFQGNTRTTAEKFADAGIQGVKDEFIKTKETLDNVLGALKQGTLVVRFQVCDGQQFWAKTLGQDVDPKIAKPGSHYQLVDSASVMPYPSSSADYPYSVDELLEAAITPEYFSDIGDEPKTDLFIGRDTVLRFAELCPSAALYESVLTAGIDLAEELPELYTPLREAYEQERTFNAAIDKLADEVATTLRSIDPSEYDEYLTNGYDFPADFERIRQLKPEVNARDVRALVASSVYEKLKTAAKQEQHRLSSLAGIAMSGINEISLTSDES